MPYAWISGIVPLCPMAGVRRTGRGGCSGKNPGSGVQNGVPTRSDEACEADERRLGRVPEDRLAGLPLTIP